MSTVEYCHVCSFSGCSKRFSKPSRLRHHEMTHTGERPYKCSVDGCDKSYTRTAHLKRHEQTAHGEPKELSWDKVCREEGCKSMFTSVDALNKHIQKHHTQTPAYKCPEEGCNQSFRKHHQLRAHRYHHQGVLPFQCAEPGCLRKFAQKSHLERHKKQHEGYQCPTEGCSLIFPKFSQLRKHKKICPSVDLLCPECGRTFHSRSWLTQHMRTHSDTRTLYNCPFDGCPRSYLDVRNLNAHIRSYHHNKQFLCEHKGCNRAFSTKQKCNQHQKLHTEATLNQAPKKYPKKGHRKKDFLTRLTGVSKSQLGEIEVLPDNDAKSDSESQEKCTESQEMCIESQEKFAESQEKCTKSQEKCAESQEKCAESQEKCTETQEKCTESQEKCTESQEKCTESQEKCTESQDKCTESQEKCTESQESMECDPTSNSETLPTKGMNTDVDMCVDTPVERIHIHRLHRDNSVNKDTEPCTENNPQLEPGLMIFSPSPRPETVLEVQQRRLHELCDCGESMCTIRSPTHSQPVIHART